MKKHPSAENLALYAGGEHSLIGRLALLAHLRGCEACAAEVESVRAARARLKQESLALPPDLDWERLAGEMRANIRLGLAAGAIVESSREEDPALEPAGWRLAVVLGSVAFVALAGWLLQSPKPVAPHGLRPAQVVLEIVPDGLAMQQQGAALTLLTPAKQHATTTVGWDGSARSSFLDDATGQVTIHNVSVQ